MSRHKDKMIQDNIRKKQQMDEKLQQSKAAGRRLLQDPEVRFHIERAAQILFVAAKSQIKKFGSAKKQANLMKEEMEEKKKEIGLVFDRNRREILKYIKKKNG